MRRHAGHGPGGRWPDRLRELQTAQAVVWDTRGDLTNPHWSMGVGPHVEVGVRIHVEAGSFELSSHESVEKPVLWFLVGFVMLLAYVAYGIYLFRGQGPSTGAVEARLAGDRKEVKAKRRSANLAGVAAALVHRGRPQKSAPAPSDSALAAQVNAIASTGTARSLQNLQNLLNTRAITDEEYEAAKEKLFGVQALDDSFAQIAKLAELHEAGVLGDVEFAAAKARVLGL